MSANLVVDLNGTCQLGWSLPVQSQLSPSGQLCGLSGIQNGATVDLINANTFCNVITMGQSVLTSGPLILQVQTSPDGTNWYDPTSGLSQMPTTFQSGGLIWLNSGSDNGTYNVVASGQNLQSGFTVAAAFQRPNAGRYARVNFYGTSGGVTAGRGLFIGNLEAGFISNLKTTGSGGGFTMSPSSGEVNV